MICFRVEQIDIEEYRDLDEEHIDIASFAVPLMLSKNSVLYIVVREQKDVTLVYGIAMK